MMKKIEKPLKRNTMKAFFPAVFFLLVAPTLIFSQGLDERALERLFEESAQAAEPNLDLFKNTTDRKFAKQTFTFFNAENWDYWTSEDQEGLSRLAAAFPNEPAVIVKRERFENILKLLDNHKERSELKQVASATVCRNGKLLYWKKYTGK